MKTLGINLSDDTNFTLMENDKIIEVYEFNKQLQKKRINLRWDSYQCRFRNNPIRELIFDTICKKWGTEYDTILIGKQVTTPTNMQCVDIVMYLRKIGFKFNNIQFIDHHLCHSSNALYTSGFSDSLIFSFDGSGDNKSTVVYHGIDSKLELLDTYKIDYGSCYNYFGLLIGIKPDAKITSGKLMALSAYGKYDSKYESAICDYIDNYQHLLSFKKLKTQIDITNLNLNSSIIHDLCKTFQTIWTNRILNIISSYAGISSNICIVGGCALNILTNYNVIVSGCYKNVFIPPNCGDEGISMGACLYWRYYESSINNRKISN